MNLAELRGGCVALLQGGCSAEREVSLNSGATVQAALDAAGFRVRVVDPAVKGWIDQLAGADFVFNILHGPGGEDGSMQGLLEHLGVPYSGSAVLGSALAMDKLRSKQLWRGQGLPTADFVELHEDSHWQGVIDQLGKVFVKPVAEGSSIGMTPAADADALAAAYGIAARHGQRVLAERFIKGPEYTISILGERALPVIRLVPAGEFYDYEAKYLSDDTRYHIPCGLSEDEEQALGALALRAFHALDCAIWGRIDVMRDAAGNFMLLEANTIPGMTSHSLVPMAARAAGIGIEDLVTQIMGLSLARGSRR
ncbi:D-alanine--D-alanine ligase [Chromatocurvus halotolerans]|uniref:D-alanine--D-alanine ligase n=1 Tax=Chromatocurvus halotolerans TaxID=1132028 RepID=A0A4R2KR97_9GAMM|nr:D-alanine--D-alanine ligase [Chromatocurvus halotolerans]TCO76194.1 D-alanine-D-alanine ligase [Chromatocurvus halotolerans]